MHQALWRRDRTKVLSVDKSRTRVDMVTTRTEAQRATTWLCLVVAVLIGLLPTSGMVVCLGHDGHVGFGVGAVSIDDGDDCPCDHHAEVELGGSPETEGVDQHPPCDDLVFESAEITREGGPSFSLAKAIADLGGDALPPFFLNGWTPEFARPDATCAKAQSFADVARRRPRQQLELRRTVVLLI